MSRLLTLIAATAFSLATASGATQAQSYPTGQPIRFVVSQAAGSGSDAFTRFFTARVEKLAGQTVIVENRVGANGFIGTDYFLRSKPDGYTLMINADSTIIGNTFTLKAASYDPQKDIEWLASLGINPTVLITPTQTNVTTLNGLVDHIRNKNGQANYNANSVSTVVVTVLFLQAKGLTATRVNYQTAAQVITDMRGGLLDFGFIDAPTAIEQSRQGGIRALGVSTATRIETAPEIPTISEAGMPGFEFGVLWSVYAPKGTPKEIRDTVTKWFDTINDMDETKEFWKRFSSRPSKTNPQELERIVAQRVENWKKATEAAGITKE